MRKIILALFIIILFVLTGIHLYTKQPQSIPVAPSNAVVTYCSSAGLKATLVLSPGAGNVYGTFTLQNVSRKKCQVVGSNFISAKYDTQTIKNITVTHIGTAEKAVFLLAPNQILYSQVHYPNGPQCQEPTQTAKVMFQYAFSPNSLITFMNGNNNTEQDVMICAVPSEMTTIQIWNMSSQPIVQ